MLPVETHWPCGPLVGHLTVSLTLAPPSSDPRTPVRATYINIQTEADRCQDLTVCRAGLDYQTKAPTGTTDRECSPLTACSEEQYEAVAPEFDADRSCADLTVCQAGEFESEAATTSSDRKCSPCLSCKADQFLAAACKPLEDAVCQDCSVCVDGLEFEEEACTPSNNTVCTPLTICGAGQFERLAPTPVADRICTDYSVCQPGQFEATPPTSTSDRVCSAISTCEATEWERATPTPVSDRDCQPCRSCGDAEFASTACTPTSNTVCAPCTVCDAGVSFASTPCSPTADTKCEACATCDGPEEFVFDACTPTANTRCNNITTDYTYSQWSEFSASCTNQVRTRQQICADKACRNPQPTEEQRNVNGGCDHACSITLTQPEGLPKVSCDCRVGFALQADGQTCVPRSCGAAPALPHASTSEEGQELVFGMTAQYVCAAGYAVGGLASVRSFSRTCQADGSLSNTAASCDDINECSSGTHNCGAAACTNLDGSHCCAVSADAEYSEWSEWSPSCGAAVRTRSQLPCAASCGGVCGNAQAVREDRTTCCPDNSQPYTCKWVGSQQHR